MSPARPPRPHRRNPVRDAFLNVPLPGLPDSGTPGTGEDADRRATDHHDRTHGHARHLTDSAMICPDGLVEEVLWGLLHGLTAPVTAVLSRGLTDAWAEVKAADPAALITPAPDTLPLSAQLTRVIYRCVLAAASGSLAADLHATERAEQAEQADLTGADATDAYAPLSPTEISRSASIWLSGTCMSRRFGEG